MREKNFGAAVLVAVFVMIASAAPVWANPLMCGRGQQDGRDLYPDQKNGFEEEFFKKAQMLLKHQEELKLSVEQVGKVKYLKLNVKKDLVMKGAQIKVIGLDVQSLLWEDAVDVDQVNALIEQKYDIKKAKAKMLVKALSDLNNILTDEQKKSLKDFYKNKAGWRAGGHGSMKGFMKGPEDGPKTE
ncbi:MAG TPA: Spy/CpxP family protein refolding chaperone [Candidatus Omnitrophota bacterium]|nr:Spy/CpxP family protein refolding chaperone [Candidatus Omnitrophota bacterium]HPN55713.1 Spy/CpxP family protein refolding chaperone [Candidatus Omnitrophota bacterium]